MSQSDPTPVRAEAEHLVEYILTEVTSRVPGVVVYAADLIMVVDATLTRLCDQARREEREADIEVCVERARQHGAIDMSKTTNQRRIDYAYEYEARACAEAISARTRPSDREA